MVFGKEGQDHVLSLSFFFFLSSNLGSGPQDRHSGRSEVAGIVVAVQSVPIGRGILKGFKKSLEYYINNLSLSISAHPSHLILFYLFFA